MGVCIGSSNLDIEFRYRSADREGGKWLPVPHPNVQWKVWRQNIPFS